MPSKEQLYTLVSYVPRHLRTLGYGNIQPDQWVSVYVFGSLSPEVQFTQFDTQWAVIVDDILTADDVPQDEHVCELGEIYSYHPDCLRFF